MKRLFTFCVVMLATVSVWAYDFEAGGIYYNIILQLDSLNSDFIVVDKSETIDDNARAGKDFFLKILF